MTDTQNRIAILGSSRGLGLAISQYFAKQNSKTQLLLASRKIKNTMAQLKSSDFFNLEPTQINSFTCDFSISDNLDPLLNELWQFKPNKIFYVSGGGPFGDYQTKGWKDHQWALNVNLLFPAELLHRVMSTPVHFKELTQIVFVGSAIAENRPDPKSASYATAKHGLKGLISSIQKEEPDIDIRLFSPGYIDTQLLPPNAWPRQAQNKIHKTETLAQILYNWCNDIQFKNQHLELEPFSK